MLGQATKASHFHPGLCQRLWDSKAGTWTKKIINLAKKIARFEAEPDVIGKVSLDIVALVCPVERHTIPRHTKCAAAQPVHSLPQLDQLVSHCDLEQATKSLQQFFPWAELGSKRMSQILTILIDICNLTSHELRSKLCSWGIGHVQTGWSPIGYEGFEVLEFSLYEMIKVSEAVPLWWSADLLSTPGCLLTVCFLYSLSWFCFAGYFFQFWPLRGCFRHSWRMPACSSFVLLLYLPIQKCETGETFNNSLVNFLGPKSQDEIESSLSKCGACPSASMKPYMKGIGRYRLGYRLRTPAFSPESVSGHSLQ